MKILVVDDEQLVRWFLERALKKEGHEVLTISNITEAFEKLSSGDVDILFIDLRMPEGSGTDLLQKIRNISRKPKIVVCSAYITPELEKEFRDNGILILKKPFKIEELKNIIKKSQE
jgi:DNA-binding NtrC family response regulator